MPNRPSKLAYSARPRRNPDLKPVLWLVIGFSLLILMSSLWSLLLFSGRIPSHQNFVGHLRPDADPIVVTLPQGAIIKDVHASRNTQIRKGQTVATLDVAAMERHVETLSAELLHDDMLRECLLLEELPDAAFFVDLPEHAQEQARLAQQDCSGFLSEKTQIMERLNRKRSLMEEERSILTHYQDLLSRGLHNELTPQQREADARQILALALLRNKLERKIASDSFDADKEGAEWQKRRLERVRLLMTQIRVKTELRHHMKSLLERPRLHAPEDGFIVQVRNIPHDTPVGEDVDLLVLRPDESVGYSASFDVPHHQLDSVSTGDRVQMTMLGMLDGGSHLTGHVSGLRSVGNTVIRAEVKLDQQSVAHLDDPEIGLALRGLGTASIIRVQKDDLQVLPVLEQIMRKGVLQPGERWFLSRLLSPPKATERPVMVQG